MQLIANVKALALVSSILCLLLPKLGSSERAKKLSKWVALGCMSAPCFANGHCRLPCPLEVAASVPVTISALLAFLIAWSAVQHRESGASALTLCTCVMQLAFVYLASFSQLPNRDIEDQQGLVFVHLLASYSFAIVSCVLAFYLDLLNFAWLFDALKRCLAILEESGWIVPAGNNEQ
jgi:hypothetical protein